MTLHELLRRVADIVLPNSGLYEYMLHTFEDIGGCLRTRYCWLDKELEDYELGSKRFVLLAAADEIRPEQLTDRENTRAKFQLSYYDDCEIDTEWERELGYCHCYIADIESGKFTLRIEEPLI
ncbi:MAG: hypothetical protein ACI4KM_04670 [Oscillospiraceae bacterium]